MFHFHNYLPFVSHHKCLWSEVCRRKSWCCESSTINYLQMLRLLVHDCTVLYAYKMIRQKIMRTWLRSFDASRNIRSMKMKVAFFIPISAVHFQWDWAKEGAYERKLIQFLNQQMTSWFYHKKAKILSIMSFKQTHFIKKSVEFY